MGARPGKLLSNRVLGPEAQRVEDLRSEDCSEILHMEGQPSDIQVSGLGLTIACSQRKVAQAQASPFHCRM